MIERIHLSIIRELDRQGSLTKAASVLCLTQSALSHTMRKLEDMAGTALWVQDGRRLRLTQAGTNLLELSRRLLPQLEQADLRLRQFADGKRGLLRIGMECHPCYQWLLTVVSPYLRQWPDVDVDVRQKFQFGGIAALFACEIDMLVTPDPLHKPGLTFVPVFDYEQVLVVAADHALAGETCVSPEQLSHQTLLTYPVDISRLDIYNRFLLPAGISPKRHITIETTDILLQMVACERGVAALPRWLVEQYAKQMNIVAVQLGPEGLHKQICLGLRDEDAEVAYVQGFVGLAANDAGTPCTL